jgi:hypothetical protein
MADGGPHLVALGVGAGLVVDGHQVVERDDQVGLRRPRVAGQRLDALPQETLGPRQVARADQRRRRVEQVARDAGVGGGEGRVVERRQRVADPLRLGGVAARRCCGRLSLQLLHLGSKIVTHDGFPADGLTRRRLSASPIGVHAPDTTKAAQ